MCVFFKALISIFTYPNNWNVDNILSVVSIILVIIGGCFAYRKWSFSVKTRRSEFINQIIEKLRFDEEMVQTMYLVDYNQYWYNKEFQKEDNILQYRIDKLMSYLSYICYLYKEHSISKKEFDILRYEVNRACVSESVQNYLWNLYHFSRKHNADCSFIYLIDYGIKEKLIPENEFLDSNSSKYDKILNI